MIYSFLGTNHFVESSPVENEMGERRNEPYITAIVVPLVGEFDLCTSVYFGHYTWFYNTH